MLPSHINGHVYIECRYDEIKSKLLTFHVPINDNRDKIDWTYMCISTIDNR